MRVQWIIVILSLTTSVGCLVAVGDMSYIRNSICAEPEVPSDWDGTLDALMACDEEFTNFGSCLLFCRNMIGSACMTACFLREANWESATLAYTLAIKYENLTRFVPDLTPELAHKQIYDEVADQNSNPSRRLVAAAAVSPPDLAPPSPRARASPSVCSAAAPSRAPGGRRRRLPSTASPKARAPPSSPPASAAARRRRRTRSPPRCATAPPRSTSRAPSRASTGCAPATASASASAASASALLVKGALLADGGAAWAAQPEAPTLVYHEAAAARVARALGVAPRLLQAADDDVEATLALQEETVREVAYDGLAIASAIALLAVGAFTPLYACVCVASTCNAVPAFLALRALTGSLAPADGAPPPPAPARPPPALRPSPPSLHHPPSAHPRSPPRSAVPPAARARQDAQARDARRVPPLVVHRRHPPPHVLDHRRTAPGARPPPPPRRPRRPHRPPRHHPLALLVTAPFGLFEQVLIRYLARLDSDSGDGGYMGSIPERWGYASSSLAIVPCAIGIVAGVFPAFNAMLLSRARAARRDAEEQYRVELEEIRSDGVASHPTKYGQQKVNKALTGPVPVSVGPAPNAASLYPVIDDAPTGQ